MNKQISVIREALEAIRANSTDFDSGLSAHNALKILTQLEAMVGEPVAKVVLTEKLGLPCLQWLDLTRQFDFKGGEFLYAAPVAQQQTGENNGY